MLGTLSLVRPLHEKALRDKLKKFGQRGLHGTGGAGQFWEVQGEDLGGGKQGSHMPG